MNIKPKEELDLKLRRKQSICPKVAQLLVDQIARELHNHAIYRTFANFYALEGISDLETYYIKRAEEEIEHHRWIADRLNYCDVAFSYPSTPVVEEEITDRIMPFQRTVDLEIETTEWIFAIADAAKEEGDWQTFHWLEKTLIDEQTEEESTSRTAFDIANMEDVNWLRRGKEILKLLKENDD